MIIIITLSVARAKYIWGDLFTTNEHIVRQMHRHFRRNGTWKISSIDLHIPLNMEGRIESSAGPWCGEFFASAGGKLFWWNRFGNWASVGGVGPETEMTVPNVQNWEFAVPEAYQGNNISLRIPNDDLNTISYRCAHWAGKTWLSTEGYNAHEDSLGACFTIVSERFSLFLQQPYITASANIFNNIIKKRIAHGLKLFGLIRS